MKICITGTAQTKFGRVGEDIGELAVGIARAFFYDASREMSDVDTIYISNFRVIFVRRATYLRSYHPNFVERRIFSEQQQESQYD